MYVCEELCGWYAAWWCFAFYFVFIWSRFLLFLKKNVTKNPVEVTTERVGTRSFLYFWRVFGVIFKQMIEPCHHVCIYINNHMLLLLLIDGVSEHFNNQKQFHVFTCSSHHWHGGRGVKRPVTLLFSVFPFDSIHPVRSRTASFLFFSVEIKMNAHRWDLRIDCAGCGLWTLSQ